MWNLETPWYELIIRGTIIYFAAFILLRFWGKKHLSQMSPFDFVLLLFISESVQNALIGDDKSVYGGLITICTFLLWDSLMNKLSFHFKKIEPILSGRCQVLIKEGVVNDAVKTREKITDAELYEALRMGGVLNVSEVKQATLEPNGQISVIPYKN